MAIKENAHGFHSILVTWMRSALGIPPSTPRWPSRGSSTPG